MPLAFTSTSRKYQSIQPRGFIGEFTVAVTGTTGATRGMAVSTTDVGADSIDRIEFDPLVNGTTGVLIPSYASGTVYFWTGSTLVGSATDLGTHSGLCRVYGTRG